MVAHGFWLPTRPVEDELGEVLRDLLSNEPVLHEPRAVVVFGLVAELHRSKPQQAPARLAQILDPLFEACRRSERAQLTRRVDEDTRAARRRHTGDPRDKGCNLAT